MTSPVPVINRREAQYAPKLQAGSGRGMIIESAEAVIYHLKHGTVNFPMVSIIYYPRPILNYLDLYLFNEA